MKQDTKVWLFHRVSDERVPFSLIASIILNASRTSLVDGWKEFATVAVQCAIFPGSRIAQFDAPASPNIIALSPTCTAPLSLHHSLMCDGHVDGGV